LFPAVLFIKELDPDTLEYQGVIIELPEVSLGQTPPRLMEWGGQINMPPNTSSISELSSLQTVIFDNDNLV